MRGAGGMSHQDDPIGISSKTCNVGASPCDGCSDIFDGSRPRICRCQAVRHIHAQHFVLYGPEHDVVVKGAAGGALITSLVGTPMNE